MAKIDHKLAGIANVPTVDLEAQYLPLDWECQRLRLGIR